MAEQLCPVCGCTITPDEAYEKEGVMYCCEPCATGQGQCECDCCAIVEEQECCQSAKWDTFGNEHFGIVRRCEQAPSGPDCSLYGG